jgi:hypothetical protein
MNGFINSPALAKLVALQMVDDQVQQNRRTRPVKAPRTTLRARLLSRRTERVPETPAKGQRVSQARKLVEDV